MQKVGKTARAEVAQQASGGDTLTTLQAARLLGLAVRSVQLMVDRGELLAWKTPGGHRRIARASVQQWAAQRGGAPAARPPAAAAARPRVLLIEDSVHFQRLVALLVQDAFPGVDLHVAGDGITGLMLYGRLQPQVLVVDILLPGIDGPTLIATLRSQPQFAGSRLIVITSLDAAERAPHAYALAGVPLVHKPHLATELPALLAQALAAAQDSQAP